MGRARRSMYECHAEAFTNRSHRTARRWHPLRLRTQQTAARRHCCPCSDHHGGCALLKRDLLGDRHRHRATFLPVVFQRDKHAGFHRFARDQQVNLAVHLTSSALGASSSRYRRQPVHPVRARAAFRAPAASGRFRARWPSRARFGLRRSGRQRPVLERDQRRRHRRLLEVSRKNCGCW